MSARREDYDAIAEAFGVARRALLWAGYVFAAASAAAAGIALYAFAAERADAGEELRLEVLAGQCQAREIGNGSWHHDNYPHELHLRSRCWSVSVSEITGAWRGWDTGLRVGYADLGSMRLDAIWWMRDEDLAGFPDGSTCNPQTMQDCLGKGHIQQRVKGVTLGGLMERELVRHVRVGLEGGLYVYEGAFDMWVEAWPETAGDYGHHERWKGLQLSPYFGVTLNSGVFMLSARVYTIIRAAEHGCSGCSGPTSGPATQIAAGLSIPF